MFTSYWSDHYYEQLVVPFAFCFSTIWPPGDSVIKTAGWQLNNSPAAGNMTCVVSGDSSATWFWMAATVTEWVCCPHPHLVRNVYVTSYSTVLFVYCVNITWQLPDCIMKVLCRQTSFTESVRPFIYLSVKHCPQNIIRTWKSHFYLSYWQITKFSKTIQHISPGPALMSNIFKNILTIVCPRYVYY